MAERSIFVKLGLQVDDFNRGIKSASSSLEELARKGDKSGQVAATGLGRMEQSARLQAGEWNQVGGALTKVGVAMGAVGAAVAVTGTRYNMLQQTSRAALTTLMGGARAANEQMDKLDAFARTSPFAKDVFIKAQQQMLAFGIESKKVIPYLDALQNAVAAAGGSNHDLAGLVEVMAKIKSSAKVTATDLMQFGNYGVDAAGLIGDAMGKTGAQIRSEITAGTLDADAALDALASGMQSKFGGAAANVKETLAGAFDRVKAAWRDMSSDLMQPFVGSQGGGIFVSLLNQTADLMRAVQRLPEPVKQVGFAFGGAATSALLLAGGFMKLAPGMMETHRAMVSLGTSGVPVISRLAASFASVPTHLNAMVKSASTGFAQMRTEIQMTAITGQSRLTGLAVGGGAALKGLAGSARSAGSAIIGALGGGPMIGVTAALAGITWAVMHFSKKAQEAKQAAREYADSLDKVTGSATAATKEIAAEKLVGHSDALAKMGVTAKEVVDEYAKGPESFRRFADALQSTREQNIGVFDWGVDEGLAAVLDLADAAQKGSQRQRELNDALDEGADSAEGHADATNTDASAMIEAAQGADEYLRALRDLITYQDKSASAANRAITAERDWINARSDLTASIDANGSSLDQNTEAGQANMKAWQDLVAAGNEHVQAMIENGATAQDVKTAWADVNETLGELGSQLGMSREEAVEFAHELGWLSDQEYQVLLELNAAEAEAELDGIMAKFGLIPEEIATNLLAFGTEAFAVAEAVQAALEANVPLERITEILAFDHDATTTAKLVYRELDKVKDKEARITAVDEASGTIGNIVAALRQVQSKTIAIHTNYTNSGSPQMGQQVKALGGAVHGAGSGTSDSISALLSNGEHVVTAYEVGAVGGQQAMYALRSMMRSGHLKETLGLATGGGIENGRVLPSARLLPTTSQPASLNVMVTAFVENPWTGEEVEARVARVVKEWQ